MQLSSMSRSTHFVSKSIPGYGAVGISPSSSRGDYTLISDVKFSSLRSGSKHTSSICNASSSYYRRNSDSSRQNKHGSSRFERNRQHEVLDGFEDLEESEPLTSKNGSLLSMGNPKFQTTATPGRREKEIVELFRKVQAQLRERASNKEEVKKVDNSQSNEKERETVDSLLKLLRKHSVQQGKKKSDHMNTFDFVLDQPEKAGPFSEEGPTSISESSSTVKHEVFESPRSNLSRPKSSFRKRSPVPEIKFEPVYTMDSVESDLDPEPVSSEGIMFDEMSEDESSEIFESEHENGEDEDDAVVVRDLSGMKVTELRALAKSRGMKGFSKMKKSELVELLMSGSSI